MLRSIYWTIHPTTYNSCNYYVLMYRDMTWLCLDTLWEFLIELCTPCRAVTSGEISAWCWIIHVELYAHNIMYWVETNRRLRQVHLELVDCDDAWSILSLYRRVTVYFKKEYLIVFCLWYSDVCMFCGTC